MHWTSHSMMMYNILTWQRKRLQRRKEKRTAILQFSCIFRTSSFKAYSSRHTCTAQNMSNVLPKTNIAPENRPGPTRKVVSQPPFPRAIFVSGRVYTIQKKNGALNIFEWKSQQPVTRPPAPHQCHALEYIDFFSLKPLVPTWEPQWIRRGFVSQVIGSKLKYP